jgi:hypothetical protein
MGNIYSERTLCWPAVLLYTGLVIF